MPYIVFDKVEFTYPNGIKALNGISLSINKGEFVAIMGENGSGKTTLAKHVIGLLKPDKGNVHVDGYDTKETRTEDLVKKIGYVFQNPLHQIFSDTVEKEILIGLKHKDENKNRLDYVINLLELSKYRNRHPLRVSEGERKKITIASILALDPDIIILDEPTLGQDFRQKKKLSELLHRLNSEGKGVILISHDVEFISENVNRVILLSQGKILADASTQEIMYSKEILERAKLIRPQIVELVDFLEEYGIKKKTLALEEVYKSILQILGGKDFV